MAWLVTGGAGYIGAHIVRAFTEDGIEAVVIDDLSSGHRDFVAEDVPFYAGSILEHELIKDICQEHQIAGVVHLAGFKYAGVSVSQWRIALGQFHAFACPLLSTARLTRSRS